MPCIFALLGYRGCPHTTLQPGTEWNGEIRTCVVTEVSRGLPNNASMFATEVVLFVIILGGVYKRNSGRHILSTIYREVRGLC